MKRQVASEAIIVPIIVRDCDWKIPELRKFKALPDDGHAITSRHWHTIDEAFANVVGGLRKLIESTPLPKPAKKPKKDGGAPFVPDDRHLTEGQRAELRKIGEEVVERQTVGTTTMPDEKARQVVGRSFGILWSQFNEKFETVAGLASLPKERFSEAKVWLQQYRASQDYKYKASRPQAFRNSILKGIFANSGPKGLNWSDADLYQFASEKLKMPVESLKVLRNDQLKLLRDRVPYEKTKQDRQQAKAFQKQAIKTSSDQQ